MALRLLNELHLEFLSLREAAENRHESTHVKMPFCWKYHAMAHIVEHYIT